MKRLLVALLAVELLLPASTARSAQGAIDPADVGVAISADESFGVPGQSATYTVVVRNNGPDPAPPVLVTLTTNAADLTDAVPTQGTCDLTVSPTQCNLVDGLAVGATATINVTVRPLDHNRASFLTAQVSSDIADPFPGNNRDTALLPTQLTVDLAVSKTSTAGPIAVPGTISYTLTATNLSPGNVTDVVFTDDISQIGTFVGLNGVFPRGTDCSSDNAGTVSCRILNVTNGQPASVTFDVRVNTCPQTATNVVTIAPGFPNLDPNPANDGAAVTSQFACADLGIAKVATPDVVSNGQLLTYTLGVVNQGPLGEGAVVTDTLPPEVDFVSAVSGANGCDFVPSTRVVTCDLGTIDAGAGTTITVVVRAATPGFVTNCAHVAIRPLPPPSVGIVVNALSGGVVEPFDPNTANNDSCTGVLIRSRADLTITKAASPATTLPGDLVTYTVTAGNNGPDDAVDLGTTVQDDLPPGMSLVAVSPAVGESCSGTTTISCSATLPRGSSQKTVIVARAICPGPLTNTARILQAPTVFDPDTTNNTASVASPVDCSADLAVTNAVAPDPVVAGDKMAYTITVSNGGPGTASNVTVTDPLPATTTLVSGSPGCSGTSTITCALGTLASGQQQQITIVVFTSQLGQLTDTATVSTSTIDPNASNDSATAINAVVGTDLAVTNAATPNPVTAGDEVTYTISVTNGGQGKASDVTMTDPLPSGLTLVSAASTRGTCTGTSTVTCQLGSLLTGEQAFVTIVARTSTAGSVANTATVATSTIDPNQSDNSATATSSVIGADLRVTKTVSPDAVPLGGMVTYSIRVESTGAATARSVVVVDQLPDGLTLTGVRVSQGSCDGTRKITCALGDLPSGGKAALALTATTTKVGSIVNTATATTSTPETAPATHAATADVDVTTADLDVTGQADPETVTPGTPVTFSFDVANNGPGPADGTTLTADLPAGAAGFEVHTTQGTCSLVGRLQCQLGTLASGDHVTVTLSMTPLTTGISTVSAEVASNQVDPITQNDSVEVRATAVIVPVIPKRVPRLAVSPSLAPAGFVARASGSDFPPGATIVLRWRPGIGRVVVVADAKGRFATSVLIFHHDQLGPRHLVATPAGGVTFDATQAPFLVVLGTAEPPEFNSRP